MCCVKSELHCPSIGRIISFLVPLPAASLAPKLNTHLNSTYGIPIRIFCCFIMFCIVLITLIEDKIYICFFFSDSTIANRVSYNLDIQIKLEIISLSSDHAMVVVKAPIRMLAGSSRDIETWIKRVYIYMFIRLVRFSNLLFFYYYL